MARARGGSPACRPGGARRARAGRRGAGAGRRPGLCPEPVQSRGPGATSGGIAVQDLCLSRRVQFRLHARQRGCRQPVNIGDWQPKNYEAGYRGPVTLRTAFAQSINTVAVQLTQAIGVERVIDFARSLGIHTELPAVPSLALGSAEVTLLDMTAAMDAIAVG